MNLQAKGHGRIWRLEWPAASFGGGGRTGQGITAAKGTWLKSKLKGASMGYGDLTWSVGEERGDLKQAVNKSQSGDEEVMVGSLPEGRRGLV